ncbi:hypothetical protein D9758_007884 [Tetrapyrgos nigripes]|uniref:F-box domain-containing protein n=1 Tax=Tetrapyrgos nigripes TaxID=182062 RepID=A0A8H5FY37_9AGAR|nr:hypothetical protein D9758_007884 [Tetrapyrgos nigripes]
MALLVDLPSELVLLILSYGSFRDILSFRLISRFYHTLVSDSIDLQYRILLQVSGMLDNPCSGLPLQIRYEKLKERERAWFTLRPRFTKNIPVEHPTVVLYDLSVDVYMLSDEARQSIDNITLPSNAEDPVPPWQSLHIKDLVTDDSQIHRKILDFGILQEQDLIAVVTTLTDLPTDILNMRVSCVQRSTGKPHPLAGPPMSLVFDVHTYCPGLDLNGDLAALTLQTNESESRVVVLNWKTSTIQAEFKSFSCRYGAATFICQGVLLVPNIIGPCIELWRIPIPSSEPPPVMTTPNLTLKMPSVNSRVELEEFSCRGAPKPSSCNDNIPSQRPFHSDPDQSILVFHLFTTMEFWSQGHRVVPFAFFVHRKTFLELLRSHEASIDNVTRHDDRNSPITIPWSSWGPPKTRFLYQSFSGQSSNTDWITTACGQRYIFFHYLREGYPMIVLDFNEHTVNRVRDAVCRSQEKMLQQNPRFALGYDSSQLELDIPLLGMKVPLSVKGYDGMERQVVGWSWDPLPKKLGIPDDNVYGGPYRTTNTLLQRVFFSEPVYGNLPYVMFCSEEDYTFDGAMMDDERVLGVKRGDLHEGVSSVDVVWFG